MAPTILIIGATGNTGRSVTEALPQLLQASNTILSSHRILGLTRSLDSPVAKHLATVPGVQMLEHNWTEITADWLRAHEVRRVFIATHIEPSQFVDESGFHLAALHAGVDYVVRISTNAPNVRPDFGAGYARTHWAIETLLASPPFRPLQWTSLQPNAFAPLYLGTAVEFIKRFRETGEQGTLRLMASEDAPVGFIDPDEIGLLAARLLGLEDPSVHDRARYVVNGPVDVTGRQIVEMVEREIGVKVVDVRYKDISFVDALVDTRSPAGERQAERLEWSITHALQALWEGKLAAGTVSKEVLELAAPKRTPAEVLKAMLDA
ncbi:NmrA-like family protein [Aspergillus homomorphus CBS 101889]|uniref:NAD(P)-binding protein n=1 Tax=Aspergillus homomorphus (strain CBS 101889) TaxID=1450537 RepID=A0A395IAM7_ASPHC|nr:NAD(P)-binding protein [Aspergillus homomorphus CBS 101889]RAL15204.1 NAD(P)-binding protein [Aspergillus homomorphus CBS 101889]